MGDLKERIAVDLKAAMKARDQLRLDTLRSALSGFIYKRTEAGRELSDTDEVDVVRRLVKQRGDSLTEYEKAGRADLAGRESAERDILMAYLPPQLSEAEIRVLVDEALAEIPADKRNQGAVMKAVMPRVKGIADGNLVREIVGRALAG